MKAKLTKLEAKLLHALQFYTHDASLETSLVRIDAFNMERKKQNLRTFVLDDQLKIKKEKKS